MTDSDSAEFRIADAPGVGRLLGEMAGRIAAECGSAGAEPVVVGILRRGSPLADRLRERLAERLQREVPCDELELKRYSDDLEQLHESAKLKDAELTVDVEDRTVVVVDDVLYSGHTLFQAAAHLVGLGAGRIRPAVLCSRGENKVPVHADFVGLQLDVGPGNIIEVHAPPYEDEWGVVLRHQPEE